MTVVSSIMAKGITMINVYTNLFQFRGSHYDFGWQQGEWLKDSPIIRNRQKQWFTKPTHRFIIDVVEFKRLMLNYSEGIWEEIIGLQDSLQLTLEDAIRFFSGYYLEYVRSGCSIFTGENFMIRNYDNAPLSYEGRIVLFAPTDGGFASIGPTMQITGRTDGMNEKGLAMGYNFINTKQSADGFVCNMIARLLLEKCATVDAAITLLKDLPHRHSFSYVLIDSSGKSVIVETSPRRIIVRDGNICTNHFTALMEENRYRMDDSLRRYHILEEKQHDMANQFTAFQMMNDQEAGIFSTNYGAWSCTLHTAIYDTTSLRAGFSIGNNRPPYTIQFANWVQGEHLPVKRINGAIPSNEPFVHMVEL